MKRIRQFLALPHDERMLVLNAAFVLGAVRVALWVLPFSSVLRIAAVRPRTAGHAARFSVPRTAWAVQVSSRWIPHATCLAQAMTLALILRRAGQSARLNIGVANDPASGFRAHAWLESGGRVVLGDNGNLHGYERILSVT